MLGTLAIESSSSRLASDPGLGWPVRPDASPHAAFRLRARRNHRTFRGTRVLAAVALGWAALIVVGFGAFVVPTAGTAAVRDPELASLLAAASPALVALGVVQLFAAIGVARDRAWGFRLALWVLAMAVVLVAGGLVFVVAGRDPIALGRVAASDGGHGAAFLAWTLGLYGVSAWGMGRVLAARSTA